MGRACRGGTEGAEITPQFDVHDKDYVLEGRTYSGFSDTGLDQLLRSLDVEILYLTGRHTNMYCRRTAADALPLGPRRGRGGRLPGVFRRRAQEGLDFLGGVYGAEIKATGEIVEAWKGAEETA